MIEMPLNRAAPTSAPSAVGGDSPPDGPEGAFAEMLGRNLGERVVSRRGHQNQESQQDAAQGGSGNGAEFYHGAIVTPWTPLPVEIVEPQLVTVEPTAAAQGADVVATTTTHLPYDLVADPAVNPVAAGIHEGQLVRPLSTGEAAQPAAPKTAQPLGQLVAAPPPLQLQYPVGPLPAAAQYAPQPAVATAPAPVETMPPTAATPTVAGGQPVAASPPHPGGAHQVIPAVPAGTTAATPDGEITQAASPAAMAVVPIEDAGPTDDGVSPIARSAAVQVAESAPEPTAAANQTTEVGGTQSTTAPTAPPAVRSRVAVPASLLNRVMEAIEHQQSQPPPRMVVVDMPELEGLRLLVSLRNDGKVHVAPLAGSAPAQVAEPFVMAVGEALAAEGFDLDKSFDDTARDRSERDDHDNPEELPQRARRPGRPRQATGLRL